MEQVRFKSGMEECTGSVDIETEVTLVYKVLKRIFGILFFNVLWFHDA